MARVLLKSKRKVRAKVKLKSIAKVRTNEVVKSTNRMRATIDMKSSGGLRAKKQVKPKEFLRAKDSVKPKKMLRKSISFLKTLVRSFYDLQMVRIELGNRVSSVGKEVHTLTEHAKSILTNHHRTIVDTEKVVLRDIKAQLTFYPVWTEYLEKMKGIGPTMAGVIISELGDILRFATISKLWSYCGYGLYNGQIQKRKKGEKSNWNTFIKSKLYVTAEGFLRSNNPVYRKLYDNYKHRIQRIQCPNDAKRHGGEKKIDKYGCTDGHRHAKSMRYMIKIFLKDLYLTWWKLEGKVPRPPYQEEYLGHKH